MINIRTFKFAPVAAALIGAASVATAQEPTPVEVTALLGVTGPLASLDVPTSEGIKLAASQVNEGGGFEVDGKMYRLDVNVVDVQGRPDQAVGAARQLLNDPSVIAILGPVASSLAVPVAEISQPRMLQLTPSTITQTMIGQPGKELLFNTLNPQYGETGIASGYVDWLKANILDSEGISSIALLLPNDSFGQLQVDFFSEAFAEIGLETTAVEIFEPGTSDFSAQLTKIKGGEPDALFWGYTDEVGKTIIRQALELGVTKKFIAAPGPSGASAADQSDRIDFAVWPSSVVSLSNPSDSMTEFVDAYEAQVGRDINPGDQFALYLYDATRMLVEAMKAAGSVDDKEKIAEALRGLQYSGVMDINVSDQGQFLTDWDVGLMRTGGDIEWTTVKAN